MDGVYEIRLKENFKMFVTGPSRCGKTFFVCDMLQNTNSFCKTPPVLVIYVYKAWQEKFEEMNCKTETISVYLKIHVIHWK